MEYMICQPY